MSSIPPDPPAAEPAAEPFREASGRQPSRAAETVLRGLRAFTAALTTPAHPWGSPPALRSGVRTRRLVHLLLAALVVALVPITTTVLSQDYGLPGAVATSLAFAQAGPLLLAVHRPLQAWWIVISADTAGALLLLFAPPARSSWPWPATVIVGYLVLCLALALRERRNTLIAVWAVTLVLSFTLGSLAPDRGDGTDVLLTVLSGVILLLGAAFRERADAQRRLAEQETISEAERGRRTLLEERARIARELHDVVAHHMSVITVQADSAPYRLSGLPPEAREEFDSIAATARESLSEMRRLLGVLRSEESNGERAPQPGLDRLGQLVEATVRAGVPTELSVAPGLSGLPQAVQLSAYRIVQEALANVVRHAPGATAHVFVRGAAADGTGGGESDRGGDAGEVLHGDGDREGGWDEAVGPVATLTVLVVNGRPRRPAGPPLEAAGTGHGLVGMRERVRLVGGTLDVGPLPDGGFRVAAGLPVPPTPLTGKDSPAS
ncbi:two-component sensor histidine kinase [Streptomyces daqingensis]|uniref:histidine kinase n=1 Tax=Streptomyces daqingensis TaxID=1472640 RepID=A0ABQ2MHZ2_9ACTN|nr:sensor histidine kinase [Streptomyces daqingensis]GGO52928.1 two-component sensor histidine kinase [Streptomyces daqingensis]